MSTNRYGLDVSYFDSLLARVARDLSDYTPGEFAREMARMSRTADEKVLLEPEFNAEEKPSLVLEECTGQEAISCGFKQGWISGNYGGTEFNVTSGAGCGNRYLQVSIDKDGESTSYRADVGVFIEKFVKSLE